MTPTEQRNLLNEGYEWCPDCNGEGVIDEPRGCLASFRCDLCGGDGVVFAEEPEPQPKLAMGVGQEAQTMEREAA